MKKDYVNLKMQVVEVQLSDCIAGSNQLGVNGGDSIKAELNDVSTTKVSAGWGF